MPGSTSGGAPTPLPNAPLTPLLAGDGGQNGTILDSTQRAAARAAHGPLLVGAGPGTGKTRTLTERVLFVVREQNVSPENVLAMTF